MNRSQKNENFIDQTFTVAADVIVKGIPVDEDAKKAFIYYKDGLAAQSSGEYAMALENYYEALQLEKNEKDRSIILYNIGLVYGSNGEYAVALNYYHEALKLNADLTQALNNIAIIYHLQALRALKFKNIESHNRFLDKASKYWKQAIRIAPSNYNEAQNWLKNTGR